MRQHYTEEKVDCRERSTCGNRVIACWHRVPASTEVVVAPAIQYRPSFRPLRSVHSCIARPSYRSLVSSLGLTSTTRNTCDSLGASRISCGRQARIHSTCFLAMFFTAKLEEKTGIYLSNSLSFLSVSLPLSRSIIKL